MICLGTHASFQFPYRHDIFGVPAIQHLLWAGFCHLSRSIAAGGLLSRCTCPGPLGRPIPHPVSTIKTWQAHLPSWNRSTGCCWVRSIGEAQLFSLVALLICPRYRVIIPEVSLSWIGRGWSLSDRSCWLLLRLCRMSDIHPDPPSRHTRLSSSCLFLAPLIDNHGIEPWYSRRFDWYDLCWQCPRILANWLFCSLTSRGIFPDPR